MLLFLKGELDEMFEKKIKAQEIQKNLGLINLCMYITVVGKSYINCI